MQREAEGSHWHLQQSTEICLHVACVQSFLDNLPHVPALLFQAADVRVQLCQWWQWPERVDELVQRHKPCLHVQHALEQLRHAKHLCCTSQQLTFLFPVHQTRIARLIKTNNVASLLKTVAVEMCTEV